MTKTATDIRAVLEAVTERILDEMQRTGWWYGDRARHLEVLRYDRPIPWDINCGSCEEWALAAQKELGGEVHWDDDGIMHAALLLDGKFYDSQALDGVDSFEDLPIALGLPRP